MLLKLCLILLALQFTNAFSEDIFKITPYTLKHTNGHLLLNFQLNSDQNLVIEDGNKFLNPIIYKKNEHYKVELNQTDCGLTKELRMKDAVSNKVVYTKSFAQMPCSSNKKDGELVFGFISDTQQYVNRHEEIARIIAHHHSIEPMQFLINGGDIVQNGDRENEWVDYFQGGKSYIMDIPQIAAIGNHDYRGNGGEMLPKYFRKYLRWEGASLDGNLYFEMPGMRLIILNSNFSHLDSKVEKSIWTFLEEKMAKAKADGVPLIVATHFPVFSSSLNRFTSLSVIKLRTTLVPLLEKYGVHLVLSGHTHMFERSYKDGINYLVAGPAGGRPNSPSYTNPYVKVFDQYSLTFTKLKLKTYQKILLVETYNQDNIIIDQLSIKL